MSGEKSKIGEDVMNAVKMAYEELGNERVNIKFLDINSRNSLSGLDSTVSVVIGPYTRDEINYI